MNWKRNLFWKRKRFVEERKGKVAPFMDKIKAIFYENLYFLKRDQMDRELFHSCVLLKNLAIVYHELPMSTDFLLEQLMDAGKLLRNIYADILTLYRRGEQETAFSVLYQRVPTKAALEFCRILSKLDHIKPSELVLQMDSFQETFSAERKTKAMARAERKSLVTTLTSTATIFIVLLNFTVVVIFLDTLRILGQLF